MADARISTDHWALEADELGQGLTNQYLATGIAAAMVVTPRTLAAKAAKRLAKERFDQAPVMSRRKPLGHVLTRELADRSNLRVLDTMHPISAETTVEAGASIRNVVPVLRDHGFAFVADGRAIVGFISPSDLNKQAARAYFYMLIARFEIALAELIRDSRSLEQQAELAIMLSNRGRDVRGMYLVDRSEGREVDYVAYMTFTHLLRLTGRDPEFRAAVGAASNGEWTERVGGLPDLRNAVMHLTRDMVSTRKDLDDLVRYEQLIRETLERLAPRRAI